MHKFLISISTVLAACLAAPAFADDPDHILIAHNHYADGGVPKENLLNYGGFATLMEVVKELGLDALC